MNVTQQAFERYNEIKISYGQIKRSTHRNVKQMGSVGSLYSMFHSYV